MKNFKNILFILLAFAGLSSCIEEDPIFNPEDSQNIVEIKSGGGPIQSDLGAIHPVYINSYDVNLQEAELVITVGYSGVGTAPQDISVNLALDPEAIVRYNQWHNEHEDPEGKEEDYDKYVMLSENLYELNTTTVTIPAGQREAKLVLKVKPNQLDFDNEYVLPFTITQSNHGTISGNHRTALVVVGAKNEWHGVYDNTFSRTRKSDGSVVVSGTNEVEYITVGQYAVRGYLIGYYSNQQTMTIDPATNKVTVTSPGIAITDDKSYYDPATKTFHIEYVALNTIMKSTLVRQ